MLVFEERGKPEFPEKNLSEQSREPTNSSHTLRRRACARNVSFRISLRWLIHIINSVDKTKLSQPTYDAGSENITRDTLVEGGRSHHYANPASQCSQGVDWEGQIRVTHALHCSKTNLKVRWTPVHKLNGSFGLDCCNNCIYILGHHVTTVQTRSKVCTNFSNCFFVSEGRTRKAEAPLHSAKQTNSSKVIPNFFTSSKGRQHSRSSSEYHRQTVLQIR